MGVVTNTCLATFLLSLSLHQVWAAGGVIINISQPGDLNNYLCGAQSSLVTNETTLELSEDIGHEISRSYCLWQNKVDITLQSSGNGEATVRCNGLEYSQTGFVFIDINRITFRNIKFENCGGIVENASGFAPLDTGPGSAVNSRQHAVLFLSRCRDVTIENVTFTQYRGYAIYAFNIAGSSRLENVAITDSYAYVNKTRLSAEEDQLKYSGSGAFFHFDDESIINPITSVRILNSSFTNNFNLYPDYLIHHLMESRLQNQQEEFPIFGAGGLTVHFQQQNRYVSVEIRDTDFVNNSGSAGGGVKIVSRNTIDRSAVMISGCKFTNNSVYKYSHFFAGGGLALDFVFYYSKLVSKDKTAEKPQATCTIEDSDFEGNTGKIGAGIAMFTEAQSVSQIVVNLNNVRFVNNEATEDGDCINVESENSATYSEIRPQLTLESISVVHTGRENDLDSSAALSFNNIFVTINGTEQNPSKISNGKNGGLKLFNTYAILTGEVEFINNSATKGGAIMMEANSYLLFRKPAHVLFMNNKAVTGGAIYSDIVRGVQCVIQFISPDSNDTVLNSSQLRTLDFNITFIDNRAEEDGDAIYAEPIFKCRWFSESVVQVPKDNITDVYNETLYHFKANGSTVRHLDQLRTHPHRPCFCQEGNASKLILECSADITPISVPPGRSFPISIVPADKLDKPVRSVVEAQLLEESDGSVYFNNSMTHFVTDLNGKKCSSQTFVLHSKTDNRTAGTIKLSIPSRVGEFITTTVILEECPFGFQLNLQTGVCDCVDLFAANNIKCNIEDNSFTKPENTYWIGESRFECYTPACVVKCPSGYCNRTIKEVDLMSLFNDEYCNRTSTENNTSVDNQCIGGRVGDLCGQCARGQSLQFGTTDCKRCTNYWLFTILLYALAGVVLVVTLFLLKLTISDGLLGTVLFYAQLFSINIGLLVNTNETRFTTVFISLLNLELGFPLCFYDGMDQAAKHGLQFVFPIYIWLIVALITFASQYSDKLAKLVGSDCSKVFVSLIYFSYTKLQRTATRVFVYATIGTNTNNTYYVWFYDGGEEYFHGRHLALALVSIFFLLFILTPYMVSTLFSHLLLHVSWISRYFKPLIDATLAPYKDRWRFWFGLRLLIINLLILISVVVTSLSPDAVTYSHIVIITLLLVFQTNIKPFKSKIVHYLELFFLINYVLFLIGCLFIFNVLKPPPSSQERYIISVEVIVLGTAFLVFVGTISCHVVLRARKYYGQKKRKQMKVVQQGEEESGTEMNSTLNSIHSSNVTLSVIPGIRDDVDDGARLRESLLGDY